jgi:zinc protease
MILKYLKISLVCIFTVLVLCIISVKDIVRAMPSVQKRILPNKLVLLVSEDHSLPMVTFQLLIDSGSKRDPAGEEGLANLTAKGILLGTRKHTMKMMNERLDFMGASLDSSCGRDYATLNLLILKKDLDKGFDLMMEALIQPTFPDEELRKEVEKTLSAIQSAEEKPMDVAEKAFLKALFLDSPYGHPVEGTRESLPRLTREKVIKFYKTYYHPNNAILSIVGDITIDEVQSKLMPGLTKWMIGKIPKNSLVTKFARGPTIIKIDRNITQANIIIGGPGINRNNPDFYALTVMNYILGGGGFASRLMEDIRNKRGLAYSVASLIDSGKDPGSYQVVLETKNPSARESISLVIQQIKRIQEEPVSAKELEGAKKYLIGSFPMRFDNQGKLANFLVQVEYYGLGLDYFEKYPSLISSITSEDVLRVAKKYLHPEEYILVVVANVKEARID